MAPPNATGGVRKGGEEQRRGNYDNRWNVSSNRRGNGIAVTDLVKNINI
jgi:hypothetical protein